MKTEKEQILGMTEQEAQAARKIITALKETLSGEWAIVGGLAFRYLYTKNGRTFNQPFNDIDIIAPTESVLPIHSTDNFDILHHHRAPTTFYFQITHKDFPWVRIDIFQDTSDEETQTVNFLGQELKIAIPEEIYLFKLRDALLLLDHPRGLPPKHIEELRFLEGIVNFGKVRDIWIKRHNSPPRKDKKIYEFQSFNDLVQEVERKLKEKADNVKDWEKSDPLTVCDECLQGSQFTLLRDQINDS